jgi:putative membrane protein
MVVIAKRTRQPKKEDTMMGWYGGEMAPLGWLGMGVFWLILLALIIWLVVHLLPGSTTEPTARNGESALEILDRRMANGEIDLAAWQAQRAALLGAVKDRR